MRRENAPPLVHFRLFWPLFGRPETVFFYTAAFSAATWCGRARALVYLTPCPLEATTEAARVTDEAQESQLSENLPAGAAAAVAARHCPVVACSFRAPCGGPLFPVGPTRLGPRAHAKHTFSQICGAVIVAPPTGGPGHAASIPGGERCWPKMGICKSAFRRKPNAPVGAK